MTPRHPRLQRLLPFLCLTILVGALAGNAGLILLARRFYAERLVAQVWPQGLNTPVLAGPGASGGQTLLLMGDSRVADWGLPQFKNWRVINAGVAGSTTAQLVLRSGELLEKTHPQIVVIQSGINDLKILGVRPELRAAVVSTTVSNLTRVAEECRLRKVRPLLTLVWPACETKGIRRLVLTRTVNEALVDVNRKLESLRADPRSFRIVDLFGDLTKDSPPESHERLYRDALHLNAGAYTRLTPMLERLLGVDWEKGGID